LRRPSITAPALLLGIVGALTASATTTRSAPVPERVAQSDAVVLGVVTALAPLVVHAVTGDERLAVATVRVDEALLGLEPGATQVRVAFQPRPTNPFLPGLTFVAKQKLCLFLLWDNGTGVYRLLSDTGDGAAGEPPTVSRDMDQYAATVAAARHAADILRDGDANLTAADPEVRMFAAWMVAVRHRRPMYPAAAELYVERPLAAGESRLILEGLARLAVHEPEALQYLLADLGLEPEDVGETYFSYDGRHARAWLVQNASSWPFRARVRAAP
jgi:hypothetical protein